jgi:hypothetical protein
MMKLVAAMLLVFCFPVCPSAREDKKIIVLPNPKLLPCKLEDCSQLWLGKNTAASAVFPKQLRIDSNQRCVYGMTPFYGRDISLDDLNSAIDERYGKWAVPGFEKPQHRLWRVEPEKFAIQLAVADKSDKKRAGIDPGTMILIFITFGGLSVCTTH